jgi:hypothetical protein
MSAANAQAAREAFGFDDVDDVPNYGGGGGGGGGGDPYMPGVTQTPRSL